jgi:hypothetical protein
MAIEQPLEVQPTTDAIPPDDQLAVTTESAETPAPAGVSDSGPVFLSDEEYMVAAGPALGKLLRTLKPTPPPVKVHNPIEFTAPNTPHPDKLSLEELNKFADKDARNLAESDLANYDTTKTHHANYSTFNTHEEAKGAMAQMAESFSKEIDESRRGIVTNEQTRLLSEELGQSQEFTTKFLAREFGEGVNAETILAARTILEGSARRLKRLAAEIVDGDDSSRKIIEFHTQFDFHRQWQAQFMGARAELGRGLQALRRDVWPTGRPFSEERAATRVDGETAGVGEPTTALVPGAGHNSAGEVSAERMSELADTLSSGFNYKQKALDVLANDSAAGVNAVVRASKSGMNRYGRAFVEHFVGSILSGIKTQVVNISGNALMTVKAPFEIYLASKMGVGLPNTADKVQAGEATAFMFGLFNGFSDALHASAIAFRTGEQYGGIGKFEMHEGKAISSQALGLKGPFGWLADVYGPVARFPMERMLGPMDAFFKVINQRARLAQLAQRNWTVEVQRLEIDPQSVQSMGIMNGFMRNPDGKTLKSIEDFGLYQTFQNPLGPGGQGFQKWVNQWPILKMMVPFVRTPTNLNKVAFLDGSPLGLLSGQKLREMFPKPRPGMGDGPGAYEQGAIEKAMIARSRMAFGTLVAASVAMYAYEGKITGSGPKDSRLRATRQGSGERKRSFVKHDADGKIIGYQSYDRLDPVSQIMSAAADLATVYKMYEHEDIDASTQEKLEQAMTALSLAISENTINKTFMMGVHEFMRAMNDPDRFMARYQQNVLNSMAPVAGLRRDARRITDPYMRQTRDIIDGIWNATPGLSSDLPPSQDIWGDDRTYGSYWWNPWPAPDADMDQVDVEVMRLLEATNDPVITRIGKNMAGPVQLDGPEHYQLTRLSRKDIKINAEGQAWFPIRYEPGPEDDSALRPVYGDAPGAGPFLDFREKIGEIINSDRYIGIDPDTELLSNEGKIELLGDLQKAYDSAARAWMARIEIDENGNKLRNEDDTFVYATDVGRRTQLKWQNMLRKLHGDQMTEEKMREGNVAPVSRQGEETFFKW